MDQATTSSLDQPIDPEALEPQLGAGMGVMSGVNCDERARSITVRQACAAVLGLLKPLPDIDTVALSRPERLPQLIDQYAAVMVLKAVCGPGEPPA